jgi:hypothetical protein
MSENTLTLEDLRGCLETAAPLELQGMRLLKERPHLMMTVIHPIPRQQVVEAVTEIVAYTERCRAAASQLANLSPIPLLTVNLLEFGLVRRMAA